MWPRPDWADAALGLTAVAGWLWGSFLNQVVDRTPYRGTPPAGAPPGPPPRATPWRPARSLCFGCGRSIPWFDNVPIVSYLLLRGRCRACGVPIGRRTLVVESLTPLILVTWHAGARAAGVPPLGVVWGLAMASWLIVGAGLLAERRRPRAGFLAVGAGLLAALVAGAALGLPW